MLFLFADFSFASNLQYWQTNGINNLGLQRRQEDERRVFTKP